MPCYDNQAEHERNVEAKRIERLKEKLGIDLYQHHEDLIDIWRSHSLLADRLNQTTNLLCSLMRWISIYAPEQVRRNLATNLPEVMAWWINHEKEDKEREAKEK